jgi:hypothetical protein
LPEKAIVVQNALAYLPPRVNEEKEGVYNIETRRAHPQEARTCRSKERPGGQHRPPSKDPAPSPKVEPGCEYGKAQGIVESDGDHVGHERPLHQGRGGVQNPGANKIKDMLAQQDLISK